MATALACHARMHGLHCAPVAVVRAGAFAPPVSERQVQFLPLISGQHS